ncbi:MAG: transposase [Patescibacteria group bacterium]
MDNQDFLRFIHDLFEFNDENWVNNVYRHFHNKSKSRLNYKDRREPRKLLVDILAFCLMPNHYHLLLSPRIENGISKFMKKMNMGYAKYFNEKYQRKGALFEGRYKSIAIKNETHFIHLPFYIHLNPLDLISPEWRKRELTNYKKAIEFLESYRWSSHLDYLGKKNFPSVTKRDFLLKFFGNENEYKKSIYNWLKELDLKNEDSKKIFLE